MCLRFFLYIDYRGTVENIQAGHFDMIALDGRHHQFGNSNGIWSHWAAGGKHAMQTSGLLTTWINFQNIPGSLVEPEQDNNSLPGFYAVKAILVLWIYFDGARSL